jgi:hypothetical protein
MNLKARTILFSLFALAILIAAAILFLDYQTTNSRLYQTVSRLEMINHASLEFGIDILLSLGDVDSLRAHFKINTTISPQKKEKNPKTSKPARQKKNEY